MADWQNKWDDYIRRNAEPLQIAQVERSRVEQFDKHLQQITTRVAQQQSALERVGNDNLGEQIESLISSERFQVKRIEVKPGARLSLQKHLLFV